MNLLDVGPLDELPILAVQWHAYTSELACDEARGLWHLYLHVAKHGMSLPEDDRDRARIAGLSHRRFVAVAPRLVPYFDVDEDGCWTKHSLVEWRSSKLDAKAKQKTDGRLGGLKKAENARRRAEEQRKAERTARDEARAAETGELPEGFAETLGSSKGQASVDLVPPSPTLAGHYVGTSDFSLGSGVASRGLTDRSESTIEANSSVCQSIETTAPIDGQERAAHPQGACSEVLGSTLGCADVGSASVPQPDPSLTLAGSEPVPALACASLSNEEMASLISAAGGDGLATNWPRKRTFRIVRAAIAEGMDLHLDYFPEVEAFAEGARKGAKGSLQFPANTEIMAAAFERRDRRLRPSDRASTLVADPGGRAASSADDWALPRARNDRSGGPGGRLSAVMQAYHRIAETLDE